MRTPSRRRQGQPCHPRHCFIARTTPVQCIASIPAQVQAHMTWYPSVHDIASESLTRALTRVRLHVQPSGVCLLLNLSYGYWPCLSAGRSRNQAPSSKDRGNESTRPIYIDTLRASMQRFFSPPHFSECPVCGALRVSVVF